MIEKQFKPSALFWRVLIRFEDGEFLFYKNSETHPFYYFLAHQYEPDHMKEKNWFTNDMHIFIYQNII